MNYSDKDLERAWEAICCGQRDCKFAVADLIAAVRRETIEACLLAIKKASVDPGSAGVVMNNIRPLLDDPDAPKCKWCRRSEAGGNHGKAGHAFDAQ